MKLTALSLIAIARAIDTKDSYLRHLQRSAEEEALNDVISTLGTS